jgi:YD repeat-containing protein
MKVTVPNLRQGLFLLFHLWFGNMVICSGLADQAQYQYDDLGRLASVADSTGAVAVYNYDAVGNLLSIDRFTPPGSGIGIYLTAPNRGSATTPVVIQGYGFSATPANNTVKFNGVTATVTAATTNRLTVTVPAGATTGSVSVTTTAGTASSPHPFTVLGAPTINSITPTTTGQGMKMPATVTGTGLSQTTGVTFSHAGITAILTPGVTDTSLPLILQVAASVPPGIYTFTLTTPFGTAGSGSVTVGVSTPFWEFVVTQFPVSVWRPNSTLSGSRTAVTPSLSELFQPAQLTPSGPTITVAPSTSEQFIQSPIAPSGATSTVTPSTSEYLSVSPMAPSGPTSTVAPPVSEVIP